MALSLAQPFVRPRLVAQSPDASRSRPCGVSGRDVCNESSAWVPRGSRLAARSSAASVGAALRQVRRRRGHELGLGIRVLALADPQTGESPARAEPLRPHVCVKCIASVDQDWPSAHPSSSCEGPSPAQGEDEPERQAEATGQLWSSLILEEGKLVHSPGNLIAATALIVRSSSLFQLFRPAHHTPSPPVPPPAPDSPRPRPLSKSGSTVGAGVLALPAATATSGFVASSVTLTFGWGFSVLTGLLIAEARDAPVPGDAPAFSYPERSFSRASEAPIRPESAFCPVCSTPHARTQVSYALLRQGLGGVSILGMARQTLGYARTRVHRPKSAAEGLPSPPGEGRAPLVPGGMCPLLTRTAAAPAGRTDLISARQSTSFRRGGRPRRCTAPPSLA